jgi:hypothetical protein
MPETGPTRPGSTHAGRPQVHDQFDISLEDSDLLGEVELTTNLIIAASESDEHLSIDEIDRILGVVPAPRSEI